MRTKKPWLFIVLILIFNGLYASSEKENRNVSGFSSIDVSSGIDLYLTMGNNEGVTVVADDNLIDDIVTEVRNGVLKIYLKNRILRWNFNREMKAYVTIQKINGLHASAGSDVVSENTIKSDVLEVTVSSGSDVKMEVEVNELVVKSSSGSDARLSGKAESFNADASSGGDIQAADLKTKNCQVEVSSGSDAIVNVTDKLIARASSGGDIRYYGNPGSKDFHESSGGNISSR